jgi:hypothetical protein
MHLNQFTASGLEMCKQTGVKQQSRSCLQKISWRKKNWSKVPDVRLTPGLTGRLNVGRKLTSTSTSEGLLWRGPAATVNYRPVLSSERALRNNKPQLSKRKSQGERKTGRGSQMGA